jgi:hypothetical protein
MYLAHGSWVPVVVFGAMFALRYFSSSRRRGRSGGPGSRSSFNQPGRPAPPGAGGASGTKPAWYRDPFFKHEHRYWSGTEWTEHVDDGGVPGTDPPPGADSRESDAPRP